MNICILCKDEDLTRAREESKNIFTKTDSSKNLVRTCYSLVLLYECTRVIL